MNVVLVGFMCSGKSRVGQALAQKLGWPHFDTDELISRDVGLPVGEIIRKRGEPAFRDVERKAVQMVALLDKAIISTGGGAPVDPTNWNALTKNGVTVWLRVSPQTVLERLGPIRNRPLIDPNDPLGSVQRRMAEREPIYSQSRFSVDTDGRTLASVVDEIISLLPVESR